MNPMLDSPLDALAFNYVSFGIFTIVNNLWTWVAVITAAVSFWRIRAAGFGAAASSCSVQSSDEKPSTTSVVDHAQDDSRPILEAEEKPITPSVSDSAKAVVPGKDHSPLVCNDGVTKGGKFRLNFYYENVGKTKVLAGEMTVAEWGSDRDGYYNGGSCGEWWESWERLLSLRNGKSRWYRYQDLTVLNGNVVRLWDELSYHHVEEESTA